MKKKIFGGIAIVAIAVTVALNVNMVNNKSDKTSLLALANMEALANGEGGQGKYQTMGRCNGYDMDFKCTTTYTSEPCTRDCP